MSNKPIRYFLFAIIMVAFVLIGLIYSPVEHEPNQKVVDCRQTTSSLCLSNLGFEAAMNSRTLPRHMREVGMLAQMGRIDLAFDLGVRSEESNGSTSDKARDVANRKVASHRISAAIRSGESLQNAIEQTPAVDPGILWISALDLLGRNPYGATARGIGAPDEQTLSMVMDIAVEIAALAEAEVESARTRHLVYAAELQAVVGHRSEAVQLLSQITPTENPFIMLSKELIHLIGTETALNLYRSAGGTRPQILLTAASAEPDPERAIELLTKAFLAFSAQEHWPDYSWMERTVKRSAELGYQDHALYLAKELSKTAQTEPSFAPVFPHIDAARALMVAGAQQSEVRQSLDLAESFFPEDPSELIDIGVVSGPIRWGKFGLDAEARRGIANLRAQLGDLDTVRRMMAGLPEPVISWNLMLTSDIPVEHLDILLETVGTVLTIEELAGVRAQLAAAISHTNASEIQLEWALQTASNILKQEQFSGGRASQIYTSIARIGAKFQDQKIERTALEMLASAALETLRVSDLIKAGFEWHRFEQN